MSVVETRRPRRAARPRREQALVYVVGARPNLVKMAPVLAALEERLPGARHVLVHTGQHYDREMSELLALELGLPEPAYMLGVGSGSHGVQTARVLEGLEGVLVAERPLAVVLPGDVNSTLAGALAAAKLGVPVAHVEAGLRSFDRSMPEEVNRLVVDQLSEWCFTHSPEARGHLLAEGVAPERIHEVGNTMIDTLVRVRPRAERSDVLGRLGLVRGGYLLVTLHRPALVDGPLLGRTMAALAELSRVLPVVFPVHPRTRARLGGALPEAPGLVLTGPLGYVEFLALELGAAGVVTDSGGVQEETTFLGVPCFTLRENTERPVTVTQGTNRLLGLEPEALLEVPGLLGGAVAPAGPPAGWDGHAAERLAETLAAGLALRAGVRVGVR